MLLSLVLSKLRYELSDTSGNDWSSTELSGILSDQQLIIVRRMCELDENYHNHRVSLADTDGVQVSADVWRYRLPRWVMRITGVRRAQTATTDVRQPLLRFVDKYGGTGWRFAGLHTIERVGVASAEDLEVDVCKRPARLTLGTLPAQTSINSNQLRLDADSSSDAAIHPHEKETDAYVNGVFQITGVDVAGSRQMSSQHAVCTASAHLQNLSSTLYTVLTMDRAWTTAPTTSDTYEMHAEVGDEHLRLLILLAARAAWTRKGNLDEVRASEAELAQEWREFIAHVQPRQLQEPRIVRDMLHPAVPGKNDTYNDNSAWFWGDY